MKLVYGGQAKDIFFRGINITLAPRETPPFSVDVMVFEEDTNLVLTVDQEKEYVMEHPIRIMTDIMNAPKHQPGTVVTNGNSWYAVVIDLDEEPICRKEWCEKAFEQVLQLAKKTGGDFPGIAAPWLWTRQFKG